MEMHKIQNGQNNFGGKKAQSYRTNPTLFQDLLQSYNNQNNVVLYCVKIEKQINRIENRRDQNPFLDNRFSTKVQRKLFLINSAGTFGYQIRKKKKKKKKSFNPFIASHTEIINYSLQSL